MDFIRSGGYKVGAQIEQVLQFFFFLAISDDHMFEWLLVEEGG